LEIELETRRKIYEIITKNPGIHFREIARLLNINIGDLQYNLNELEKERIIVSRLEGGYKRYYPEKMEDPEEKVILPFLRQTLPRRIIITLLKNEKITPNDIAKELNVGVSTILYHVKKMISKDLVGQEKDGKNVYLYLKKRELFIKTVIKYRESFLDKLVDSFVEFWKSSR